MAIPSKTLTLSNVLRSILVIGLLIFFGAAKADKIPAGWSAENMEVVSYTSVDGKPGFKISLTRAGDRLYAITAHYSVPGWSVIDVTDPKNPQVVKFIPGPENTNTVQVDIADGIMVAALGRPENRDGTGLDPNKPYEAGVIFYDVKDPLNPKELGRWHTDNPSGRGTHRNSYSGGRYVHLAADMKGYDGDIYVILDIIDPSKPVEVGRWWMPGQHVGGGEKPQRDPNINLHNPNFVDGNLVYLSYGDAGMVILDISDITKPKFVSQTKFQQRHRFDVHTVSPALDRKLVYVNSEAVISDCKGPLDHATVVDISNPVKPFAVGRFPTPVPPAGLPFKNFCDKGGRFGPHNMNQLQYNPNVQKQGNLVYLTWFNAGLRVYDVSDKRMPREVGSFVAGLPEKVYIPSYGNFVRMEDVFVDNRGYIYVTGGAQQGIYILRYTGPVKN